MKIETLAVHAGQRIDPATGAVSAPIHLSTTFERDAEGTYSRGFMYTRNNNPNRQALEEGVSALEGGAAAAERADSFFQRLPVWIIIARVHESARVSSFRVAFEGRGKMNGR